jgi:hypothetical protein
LYCFLYRIIRNNFESKYFNHYNVN